MSQPVLLKVYGSLYPASESDRKALALACSSRMPQGSAGEEDAVVLEGDLLRISFEGLFFPADELLAAIAGRLGPEQKGKLDVLDLEAWRLERHVFANGRISQSSAPLNNVLDFSGH